MRTWHLCKCICNTLFSFQIALNLALYTAAQTRMKVINKKPLKIYLHSILHVKLKKKNSELKYKYLELHKLKCFAYVCNKPTTFPSQKILGQSHLMAQYYWLLVKKIISRLS